MKLEFLGIYKNHELKKTKTNKDYCELNCLESISNKSVRIFIFDSDVISNLNSFNKDDSISVIFETWYSHKDKNNVLIVKDVVYNP